MFPPKARVRANVETDADGGETGSQEPAGNALGHLRILIVDDEWANVRLLERLYATVGYTEVVGVTDPRRAIELDRVLSPDLVVLDLRMPHLDGFAVLRHLAQHTATGEIRPVIVLTADESVESRRKALLLGATEFLTKPFQPFDILLRTRNLLQMRNLHLQLQERNRGLEERVVARTRDLERAQAEVLQRLAQAVEARDGETGEHTRRVGENSALLASALGLSAEHVELIRRAAPLHDVGKIGIPDAILLKPGTLTPEEFDIAKTHTTLGAKILSQGESEIIRMAERIALSHHERWNGTGYPHGLRETQIPLEARIVTVVDVFDALAHDRSYRRAWPVEKVCEEIRRQAGDHFDPDVVTALLELEARDRLIV